MLGRVSRNGRRIRAIVQWEMEALEQDPAFNRSVAEIGEELGNT